MQVGAEAQRGCVRSLISGQNSDSAEGLFGQIPAAGSWGQPWIACGDLAMELVTRDSCEILRGGADTEEA